ncbi:copper homeostasis CutC domain-containing protein [Penicillium taxi]|uniref:copper homeostasis CutC domain-containing protein n=1 Tax=Penicillium taxi TaxID=168475 RepID=UPI0025458DDE|nr:copper homeostasis CutC domain-containing protein [Penicillium taxi]KAJ5894892.1 copper homeostasis CutC domain-containing protein [Penicillium taxi]
MDNLNIHRKVLLEIACFNEQSAINAMKGGADRIELCHDYASGGLSPDETLLARLKSLVKIPIYVMIRPRPGNFCYDNVSFETMKSTLTSLKNAGADGFVFGILNEGPSDTSDASWVDVARNKELVQLAGGKPCTFHRAFDCIDEAHWGGALTELMECGFTSILTSGPSGEQAIDCIDALARLCDETVRPEIIIGGGVRFDNVGILWQRTHGRVFHSSALGLSSEIVEANEVRKLRESLRQAPKGDIQGQNFVGEI